MQPNTKFIELRKRLGPSQLEFAEKIRISRSTIADIERGRIGISKKVREKIVEKFPAESGFFDNEKPEKIGTSSQGSESGSNQVTPDYTNIGGENKAILDTYRMLEGVYLKGFKTNDLKEHLLNETSKMEDKTLHFYLRSTDELKDERPDLGEMRVIMDDIITGTLVLNKIVKTYFESIYNANIEYTDYEDFKAKRIENFEKLFEYIEVVSPFAEALNKFIADFKKYDSKKAVSKAFRLKS